MDNRLVTPAEAVELIESDAIVVFAGAEEALGKLPRGRWIGGTTAYYMTSEGCTADRTNLFATVVTQAAGARITSLAADDLHCLAADRFATGFSYILLPAFTEAHRRYAIEGPAFDGLFEQPTMGWVTGVHLSELGERNPKVFDGSSGAVWEDRAVVMHVQVPHAFAAELDIVNLFEPGDGPEISFPETSFSAQDCWVDGKPTRIARYLVDAGIDTRLPLVADYAGVLANVAVRAIDPEREEVDFYAPVVRGQSYRIARPVRDFRAAYMQQAGSHEEAGRMLACNCILNYLHAELEGKSTGGFLGPITFGEIAYMLLNQTLVRLNLRRQSALASAFRRVELAA